MTTKRSLIISTCVIALAAAVSSCGGQPFPGATTTAPTTTPANAVTGNQSRAKTPQARLLAAAQLATEAKTARLSVDATVSGLGDVGTVTLSGAGVVDLTNRQMQLTFDAKALGETASVEVRIVGATAYLKEDGDWTSMPFATLGANTPNPGSYLDFLQGVAGNVRVEGHDTLRGVDTTRYGATLDLARALARANTKPRYAALQHEVSAFGLIKIPVTVWLDADGRVRKLQMLFDLGQVAGRLGAPAGSDPKMVISMELYDFGVPVVVLAPVGAKTEAVAAQDRGTESDLRNALTAEKTVFTDNETYTADPSLLKQIEPSLDWGGKLTVVVGSASGDAARVVCLSQRSKSGTTLAIADVASGPGSGTYYATSACPPVVNEGSFSGFVKTGWK